MGTIRAQIKFLVVAFLYLSFSVKADPVDYSRLIFKLKEKKSKDLEPLYLFSTLEDHTDTDIHEQNQDHFNHHPEIIRKIKADLDCQQPD